MLPASFAGQRVQCPQCLLEFAAQATPIPPMEVDAPAPAPMAESKPAAQTGYAAAPLATARAPAAERPAIYCVYCGTKCSADDDECPDCGQPIYGLPDELPREGRWRRARVLLPVRGTLPILGAILVVGGFLLVIAAPISHKILRGTPLSHAVPTLLVIIGFLSWATALTFFAIWLYQAWRAVLHGDEEYSPGLMVGLLFVPFFNLYWIFRAIPGLSTAIQQELRYVAPRRVHGAGWVAGLIACILALIPYGQPIALCIFLAWMLIANNALQKLIRCHAELRAEEQREAASEPEV
jgi:hypothetical protein